MKIIKGDITKLRADVIVNAANGYIGCMGAGVAGAIRRVGGMKIEADARGLCKKHKFNPGEVYFTEAGSLDYKHVIHAVTMKYPGEHCSIDIVKACLLAIFEQAKKLKCSTVIIPGLGTKIGRLPPDAVAAIYCESIPKLEEKYQISVTVCDIDSAFIEYLERFTKERDLQSEKVISRKEESLMHYSLNVFQAIFDQINNPETESEVKLFLILDLLGNDYISLRKAMELCTNCGLFSDAWSTVDVKATRVWEEHIWPIIQKETEKTS